MISKSKSSSSFICTIWNATAKLLQMNYYTELKCVLYTLSSVSTAELNSDLCILSRFSDAEPPVQKCESYNTI